MLNINMDNQKMLIELMDETDKLDVIDPMNKKKFTITIHSKKIFYWDCPCCQAFNQIQFDPKVFELLYCTECYKTFRNKKEHENDKNN